MMHRPGVCLTVPFYTPENKEREEEIYSTLEKNIEKEYIHKIILLIDDESFKECNKLPDKVECIYMDERPTYKDWLINAQSIGSEHEFQIFANADIEMYDNLQELLPAEMENRKTFAANSRYDIDYSDGSINSRQNPHWTQDTWCIKTNEIKNLDNKLLQDCSSIPVGTPRCDNKIVYIFWLRGWTIINPCNRIKTKHHQKSDHRGYQKKDTTILGSVLFPHPSSSVGQSGRNEISVFTLGETKNTNATINNYLSGELLEHERVKTLKTHREIPKRFNTHVIEDGLIELRDTMFPGSGYKGESLKKILLTNIKEIYSKINIICKRYDHCGDNDHLFWQFPAITEKDAYLRHLKTDKVVAHENSIIKLYFPFPWATFIDKEFNTKEASFRIAKKFISGIRDILNENKISFEIHTVCQHIRWKDILFIIKDFGITDLHASHSMSNQVIDEVNIHPWVLFAPNIEDPSRSIGLNPKSILARNYLASFIGAYMKHYLNDDRKLLTEIESSNIYIQVTDMWHLNDTVYKYQVKNQPVPKDHDNKQIEKIINYNKILSDSKFALCPIGAGPNTLRFWESIAIGSIPVFFNTEFVPPFFEELIAQKNSNEKLSDIFVYVNLERNNPGSFIKVLESYSSSVVEHRSQLCKEYYSFAQERICFQQSDQSSKVELKEFKVDFYRWPNPSFPFRLYFDHPKLRVFIIENIMHNWDWLSKVANHITERDFFYVYCGWYHDEYFAETYSRILLELGLSKRQFYIMFNSVDEMNVFKKYGFYGEVINHNCWLDWNKSMKIIDNCDKLYDAIYVGRRSAFKRHMLAKKVNNLAIIAGNNHGNNISEIPHCKYNNEKPLTANEVCEKINQSKCGLLLSETEGACFSSSEYLLCGIPVVSTVCNGGRDYWYNSYNSIVVEPDEDKILEAVKHFNNTDLNPEKIRNDHIELSIKQRQAFNEHLQKLFIQKEIELSADDYFGEKYIHKLRGGENINNVISYWL
jgi:glycosyltransferase involved in cell wall biosynthesis